MIDYYDDIITAADARQMAYISSYANDNRYLRKINKHIKKACKNGDYRITVKEVLPQNIVDKLKTEGYFVRFTLNRIVTYEDSGRSTIISWDPSDKDNII